MSEAPAAFDLPAAVRDSLANGGDGEALAFGGAWRSWAWLAAFADRLDALVAAAGAGERPAIGLVARNRPAQIAALAAQLAGRRATVMIYSAQSPAGIAADIARIGVPIVLADPQDWTPETIAAAAAVGTMAIGIADGMPATASPVAGAERVTARFAPRDEAVAFELLSSGTTGPPKRIPLGWAACAAAVRDARAAYAGTGRRDAPQLMTHPLGNVAGVGYIAPALAYRQPVVLLEKFDVRAWADAVRDYRPIRASLPPAGVRMLLDADVTAADLASLSLLAVGGGRIELDVQDAFEARYGIPILTAFGATEFGGVIANWSLDAYREHGAAKRGSVGRASPNVALRIVDRETFAVLGPGEIGLMEARVARIGPDWIRTNDLAALDADGFLFLHGRADAAINRGGFKIVPDVVAAALRTHPAVADAGVVGLPDRRLGEVPVAAVELVADAAPVTPAELAAHLRDRLVAYQLPTEIRIVGALPRNPSMKISAPDVKALFLAKPPA